MSIVKLKIGLNVNYCQHTTCPVYETEPTDANFMQCFCRHVTHVPFMLSPTTDVIGQL